MAEKVDYINRSIEKVITEAAAYFSVISVTGPRQSGKSTMLKHLFPTFKKSTLLKLPMR